MGEVEAKRDEVTRHELRHDRHTVSLLTDHLVFSPKYRGKVLLGEVAEVTEEIIRGTCKELDIEVIDLAVNVDHIHLFIIKYPPKYSVSWIAKRKFIYGQSVIYNHSKRGIREVKDKLHLWTWMPRNLFRVWRGWGFEEAKGLKKARGVWCIR